MISVDYIALDIVNIQWMGFCEHGRELLGFI
jgi:hypothetical protein